MNDKKILIVYYSLQGNAREVAKAIQNASGGDIFELELTKPYSVVSAYALGSIHAMRGHGSELKNQITNLHEYDTVFVGAPVWAYALTPPLVSFLKEYDLTDKTVIPFCTHGGNMGKYFEKFAESCPNADIAKSKGFLNVKSRGLDVLNQEVNEWLQQIQDS